MGTTIRNPLISLTLTLGAMLGMFGLTNHPHHGESFCKLKIDYPHSSTFLFEQYKKLAVKTNARTECNLPQMSATVWMELFEVNGSHWRLVQSYKPETLEGGYSPHLIKFEGFYTECSKHKSTFIYQAKARAVIRLRSGKIENTESKSNKSLPLNCWASTKLNT